MNILRNKNIKLAVFDMAELQFEEMVLFIMYCIIH